MKEVEEIFSCYTDNSLRMMDYDSTSLSMQVVREESCNIGKQIDVKSILSLPDGLYEKKKKNLVFWLKENNQKLNFNCDSYRFIFSPPTRMKDFELLLFGKKLTPKERMSGYRLNLESRPNRVLLGQAANQVSDLSDRSIILFFIQGQQLLMLLTLCMVLNSAGKSWLMNKKDVIEIVSNNAARLEQHSDTLNTLTAWLKGGKSKDTPNPSPATVFDADKDHNERNSQENELIKLSGKVADATNKTEYKPTGGKRTSAFNTIFLTTSERYKNWLSRVANSAHAEKEQENRKARIMTSDIQAVNNMIKKTISAINSLRTQMSHF